MISRTAQHAIRAVVHLARLEDGSFVGAAKLSETTGAPPNYLGKLMQSLAAVGLLESRKGAHGGFALAAPAHSIRLLDVVEPIDGVSRWEGCFLGQSTCSVDNACAVHERWALLRDEYLGLLRDTTIAELVAARELDPLGTLVRKRSP